jgi:hypothetical protein
MLSGCNSSFIEDLIEDDIWLGLQRVRDLTPEERHGATDLNEAAHHWQLVS